MSGEGFTNSQPLDTATLSPIRVEPNAIADRARVVRNALLHLADRSACPTLPVEDRNAAFDLSGASDETLAKLGRLLK